MLDLPRLSGWRAMNPSTGPRHQPAPLGTWRAHRSEPSGTLAGEKISRRTHKDAMASLPFDFQPRLKGRLLELRPLARGDYRALYACARDPLIWEQHPQPDRWREPVFRDFFKARMASGGALLALDGSTGEVIGTSEFHDFEPEENQVEIGFTFLRRANWGGQYNGEMKQLMLDHAFRFVDSVLFNVGECNVRSQRAVEKIGGEREGVVLRGEVPYILFRIRRSDWISSRGTHQPEPS